jgi:Amt family ammonium transporter
MRWLLLSISLILLVSWPSSLLAQSPEPTIESSLGIALPVPSYWFLLTAAIAMLVPAGFVLMSVAGLEPERAWDAALGGMAALGLASFGYWAVGYALQFGGVGLVYPQAGLQEMVWEWSPFSADWGIGWGVAGLSGWFLSGSDVTALAYALFLAHIPWAMTAALVPIVALRGRAPATATLLLSFCIGAFVYPLAGNWVQGGGWLGSLGNNLILGHGFVDFGGAGTVHLVAAGFALAALVVWVPRRQRRALQSPNLVTGRLPMLAVVGSLFVLGGSIGWLWSNPLQMSTLDAMALMRGSVNIILFASGGMMVPLAYTWFVTGRSEPLMSTRGLAAGVVAGLAVGPFVQPGIAFLIGLLAGATVPFVSYLVDGLLRLDDATGAVTVSGLPAMVGLLLVGLFADGATGQGWQMTGLESYLGVSGQGVSGLFTARGFQMDFPGQLQAQVIGILALALWGFLVGMLLCVPLGLLLHGLLRSSAVAAEPALVPGETGIAPVSQATAEWRNVTRRPPDERQR